MSSSAKKLTNPNENKSIDSTSLPQLSEFIQLKAAVISNELFKSFEVLPTSDESLHIVNYDTGLIILGEEIWQDEDKFNAVNFSSGELIVLCQTQSKFILDESHKYLANVECVILTLPLSVSQLYNQLQIFLSLQSKLNSHNLSKSEIEETNESIKYVLRVSRELNGLRDTNKLLSLILKKAREICNADAGSIYVVAWEDSRSSKGNIHFKITQNESVQLNLQEFQIPISENSIVGNAVIHEKSINIDDLYQLDPDRNNNPYRAQHDRSWDDRIGYQCRSMLTVPMFDIGNRVIGVIQLINKKTKGVQSLKGSQFDSDVLPFDLETVEYAEIIAYQAGIALENALLTEERELLFEGFVHASVTAIEQRDPTTSGHSNRVALLTLETAKLVDRVSTGPYADVKFTDDQLKEVEYASLLHDFGKLGVREEVLVKANKLYPLQKELVLERFDHARTYQELVYLKELSEFYLNPERFPPGTSLSLLKAARDKKISEIDDYLDFILKCNEPTVLEQGGFERLKDIANAAYMNTFNKSKSLLLDNELKALSVSRGSLTREEFAEIQSHVTHTYEFLRKIPWGTTFANLPQIAAKHHEKLDGSGYPTGAQSNEIPVQSRIMTIADIYDALTASDRPYKKSVPALRALEIIEMEVKSGKVDKELFNIFVESKIYKITLE